MVLDKDLEVMEENTFPVDKITYEVVDDPNRNIIILQY